MTNKRSFVVGVLMAFMVISMVSCKPGIPKEYIQPGDMEDILYDYHIAMGMAEQGDPATRDERVVAYKQAVLRKYGYSEQQIDNSMKYYVRHTEELHDIYDKLAERLNDEAKELGANSTDLTSVGDMSQQGDTANVWTGSRALVLSPVAEFNSYTFALKADTSYHKGDRIALEFNATYIIQEGMRNAVAVMAITLGNDSVVSQTLRITSDSHQSLVVGDYSNLGIKAVRGYILFPRENSAIASSTMKILCVDHIRLIRMHSQLAPEIVNGQATTPGGKDSIGGKPTAGSPVNNATQPLNVANPPAGNAPRPANGKALPKRGMRRPEPPVQMLKTR